MAGFCRSGTRTVAWLSAALLAISLATLITKRATAQAIYDYPTLVADPGLHTGIIRSAAIDKAGRFFVTGSEDKTVRIWSVDKGDLLQTIRMPVGADNVGAVFSVAMNTEGDLIAVGGWTSGIAGQESIYLFNKSGAVIKRIGSLTDAVNKLVFSADGRYLAAAFRDYSLHIFDRDKEWTESFQDADYGKMINGITFAADGRLATASYDGKIRLYDPDFKLVVPPQTAVGGKYPFNIAFNPDGNVLAVGYADAPFVELLAADSLQSTGRTNAEGLTGSRPIVAWSADGQTLFAGRQDVFAWSDAGRGQRRILKGGNDTLMSLNTLPDGGVLITTADPLIRQFNNDDSRGWEKNTRQVDVGNQNGILAVSEDGTIVDFGFDDAGKARLRFDVNTPKLIPNPPADGRTVRPKTDGLKLERRGDEVFFDDKLIEIDENEKVRGLAISSDNRRFVIGGSWSLRARNSNNERLWRRDGPDVWSVNITGNGRLLVAAHSDGTIRWRDMESGQVLLTLLVLIDSKETNWVAWTPEGFYGATGNAFGVLQWHVNHGVEAAGTTVRASDVPGLYRPEALAEVLQERGIGLFGIREAKAARAEVQRVTGSAKPPGARLHVLAIGVSQYGPLAPNLTLKFADKDALDLVNKLDATQGISGAFKGSGGLYAEVLPIPIVNKDANTDQIYAQFEQISAKMVPGDTVIVMFAGHGMTIDNRFYLLPFETNTTRVPGSIKASAIDAEHFRDDLILPLTRRGRVLVLLDACHSGAVKDDIIHGMAGGNVAVLTSSSVTQTSREDVDWQNGAFTKLILDALSGSDSSVDTDHNGVITMNELESYLAKRLPELTKGAQELGSVHTFSGDLFSTGL